MSTDTLSTAQDEVANASSLLKHTPVDIDKNPIIYDGNPAHVLGVLHEVNMYWTRTGLFQSMLKTGCAPLSNGKEAIDSLAAVPFVTGSIAYGVEHGFDDPCPPTPQRVELYDKYVTRVVSEGGAPPTKFLAPSSIGPGSNLYNLQYSIFFCAVHVFRGRNSS